MTRLSCISERQTSCEYPLLARTEVVHAIPAVDEGVLCLVLLRVLLLVFDAGHHELF